MGSKLGLREGRVDGPREGRTLGEADGTAVGSGVLSKAFPITCTSLIPNESVDSSERNLPEPLVMWLILTLLPITGGLNTIYCKGAPVSFLV